MELQKAKAEITHFRNHLLERQKIGNYQNELERIKGELAHFENKGLSHNRIRKRIVDFEKLKMKQFKSI